MSEEEKCPTEPRGSGNGSPNVNFSAFSASCSISHDHSVHREPGFFGLLIAGKPRLSVHLATFCSDGPALWCFIFLRHSLLSCLRSRVRVLPWSSRT